jgi:hypothetical protein
MFSIKILTNFDDVLVDTTSKVFYFKDPCFDPCSENKE